MRYVARRSSTPAVSRLLDSANGLPAAKHASSLRLLRTAYTGNCIRVRRSSDNTTMDIGFVSGVLDTATMLTFVGAGDGFIVIAYDQSGNGLDALYPTTASQERIVHAGVLEVFGPNSKAAARALGSGYGSSTNPFTAYTGSLASASFVGGLSNNSASVAPCFIGLHPSDTSKTVADVTGAVLVGRKDTVNAGKAETLVDDFTTQNGSLWTGFGTNCVVTGGGLSETATSAYIGVTSVNLYDLTNSHFAAGLITRSNVGTGTIEDQMMFTVDNNNQVGFVLSGNTLAMRQRTGGVNTDSGITYNATSHKYWRLRHSGTTLFWETSPDNSTWTTRLSATPAITLTSGHLQLIAGYYGTEPTVTAAVWDNVNTVVGSTVSNNWAITRVGTYEAFYSGTYGAANSVYSVLNAGTYAIYVDGVVASGTDTSTALSCGSLGFGMSSPTQFANATDCYWQERIVWLTSLTSTQQATLLVSQETYYGTTVVSGGTGGGNGSSGGGSSGGGGTGRFDLEANGYTLQAQENFVGTSLPSTVSTYDNGTMTSGAGAWMANMVSVGPSVTGDGTNCLKVGVKRVTTPVNGYNVTGGAATLDGSTFRKKGGAWEYRVRSDANTGTGEADLMWNDTAAWPLGGEIDIREIYANSSGPGNWQQGESNFHLDTVANSGRHLKSPASATHSPGAMTSAGNYQTDWTTWHIVQMIWNPVSPYNAVYIDGVLVGYTTDHTYIPNNSDGNAGLMRLTFQTEHYGATDASVSTTTRYTEVDYVKYYSLP